MDDKIQEWLKSLKIGDKVAVRDRSFNFDRYKFGEVIKITPKGAIRVSTNSDLLFKDGYACGSSSRWNSSRYYLEPITEELTSRLALMAKREKLIAFAGWAKLEEPVINKIYELIPGI